MAWFRCLVSRLMIAVRYRRHPPKTMPKPAPTQTLRQTPKTGPKPTPAPTPISTNLPEPATATAAPVVPALPSFDDEPTNLVQIQQQRSFFQPPQRPPPLTRTSDSVLDALIRISTDGERLIRAAPRIQQQQQQLFIQLPEDEVRKQTFNNPGGLSPGEWDWSSRSSRCTSISSCVSTSRDSFHSKASTNGESLSAQLRRRRKECHRDRRFLFIPKCDQESLLTIPNIEKDIRDSDTDHFLDPAEIRRIAEEAFNIAPKLFAILACLGRGSDIHFLLEMKISDNDLPFEKTTPPGQKVLLRRKSGELIEAFGGWDDEVMEDFHRIQWWILAPVFEVQQHYDLEDGRILPFIHFEEHPNMEQEKRGGYSEVYPARFHPSHHNFWQPSDNMDDEPLLAIKQLYSESEIEFEKERTILTMLDSNGIHPHRITLLATFKYLRKYHLVFRYADANLRKYWKDRPFPSFDKATVHWCLRQMAGLSNSLLSIHDFSVRSMLDGDGKERLHKDTNPSATEPLKRFGRHGDIKAENILHFKQSPGSSSSDDNDDNGTLQLADFGLSRVHRRDSRSNVPWDKILGSPTYEPPELKLHLNVSRAYDIWSLGCLYLDFITWLLEGSDAITSFTQTRACAATSSASDDESFFSIVGGVPVVRQEVLDWVARLHRHEKCSALIHDLLEIIMRDMLCPKSAQRTGARWVDHLLFMRLKAANEDEDYLLKPMPVQQQTAQDASTQSTSPALMTHGDTPAAKWMSVTLESEEKGLPALENGIKFPKDLLRRNEGTPGQRLTRAKTFKT